MKADMILAVEVIDLTTLVNSGCLRALASVRIEPFGITIRDCRVIQQDGQKAYVALPQRKARDGKHYPILTCDKQNLKDAVKTAVLAKWSREKDATKELGHP